MIKATFEGVLARDQRLSGHERVLHVSRREAARCHLCGVGQEARVSQGEEPETSAIVSFTKRFPEVEKEVKVDATPYVVSSQQLALLAYDLNGTSLPPVPSLSTGPAGYSIGLIQLNNCLRPLWVMAVCLNVSIGGWGGSSFGKSLTVEI